MTSFASFNSLKEDAVPVFSCTCCDDDTFEANVPNSITNLSNVPNILENGRETNAASCIESLQTLFEDYLKSVNRKSLMSVSKYKCIRHVLNHPTFETFRPPPDSPPEDFQLWYKFKSQARNYIVENNRLFKLNEKYGKRSIATTKSALTYLFVAHDSSSHLRIHLTHQRLQLVVDNISREEVRWFISNCSLCKLKKLNPSTTSRRLVINNEPLERLQVDMLDYSRKPFGIFKYVLQIKDCASKLKRLYPLNSNSPAVIAQYLDEFVRYYGAPRVLQCDPSFSVRGAVMVVLKNCEIKIIYGKTKTSRNQKLAKWTRYLQRKLQELKNNNSSMTWNSVFRVFEDKYNHDCGEPNRPKLSPHMVFFFEPQKKSER